MFGDLIKADLEELVENISKRNMYSGNRIPDSVMKLFGVEVRQDGAGVVVPYWISVLQKGRGPRRGTKDYGLVKKIYRWMENRSMFKSTTARGRMNEAKSMTWYINKYGNKHFRSQLFVDIYESERKKTIAKIDAKINKELSKITMDIL